MMGLNAEDETLMHEVREYINDECKRKNKPLNKPFSHFTTPEMYRLIKTMIEKTEEHFGDKVNVNEDIIGAIIHRLCLDNVRKSNQKIKRRLAKGTSCSTPGPAYGQTPGEATEPTRSNESGTPTFTFLVVDPVLSPVSTPSLFRKTNELTKHTTGQRRIFHFPGNHQFERCR